MDKKQIMDKIKELDTKIDTFMNLTSDEKKEFRIINYISYYNRTRELMKEATYWRLRLK